MFDNARRTATVVAVVTAVFVLSAWHGGTLQQTNIPRDAALIALNTLPLLAARRNPLAVVAVFCVAYPLWPIVHDTAHPLQSLPTLAALYALGGWDRPLWIRSIGLLSPAYMFGAVAVGWWPTDLLLIGYVAVVFVAAWVLGATLAARRRYIEELEGKTRALSQARRELADREVADERARIARELHDVVAHSMSVIAVRAGVGAHVIDARPDEARQSLQIIEHTGRQALAEMRRMLAVLRDPDPNAPRPEPTPGLRTMPALAAQVREADVPVSVTVEGRSRTLPAGLDLAAYRVLQEALTNVVKHAPGTKAEVLVRYGARQLDVEVTNPLRGGTDNGSPGQGLRGMAERVALYDGRLSAEVVGESFQVSASFPLDPEEDE